jgi:hypothetical protein
MPLSDYAFKKRKLAQQSWAKNPPVKKIPQGRKPMLTNKQRMQRPDFDIHLNHQLRQCDKVKVITIGIVP